MSDSKYVVLKRADLSVPDGDGNWRVSPRAALDDAVVIRRQDVFAPPALDAYANAITVTAQVLKAESEYYTLESVQQAIARLEEIADYFHEQAKLAWDCDRKLPD